MATLIDGQEYGLASNDLLGSNKTVIHFKLTDSCLKTLEDLSKKGIRPNIQFEGNHGVIRIPSHVSSGVRQPEQTFQLSFAALPVDKNSSFECIKQSSSHGTSSLHTQGSMQHRVIVKATDDVFDRTRANMKNAEEENKKVCTKEIKQGKFSSTRVRKVIPPSKIPPVSKPSAISSLPKSSPFLPKPTPSLKSSPSSSLPSRPLMSSSLVSNSSLSSSSHLAPTLARPPTPSTLARPPTPSTLSLAASTQSSRPLASSKPLSNNSKVLTSSSSKPTSGAINMPYRDRVIHLLALHHYKKPELMLRLQKDGIREKDKGALGGVLQSVATVNKDNTYNLSRAGWIDVRQDWPYYSDQDKEILKKNLQERCISPASPAVSPASSNPESPGSSMKRGTEELEDNKDFTANKRKRIAHNDRRQPDIQVSKPAQKPQTSPNGNRENVEGTPEEKPERLSCFQEMISKFPAISSRDRRSHYKSEFNHEYVEYHKLHAEVDTVASKFTKLREKIDQTEEGTQDFEALKTRVLEEYEAMKSDPKFLAKKQRMEYLHQKLGHIKRRIHDYDHRGQVLSPAS